EEQDGVAVAAFGGGHIEVPNDACLALTNSFTLEAWIRPDARSKGARIFDKLTAGKGDGFLFDTHPGRSLRFITGSHAMAVNDVLQPGAWNHVVAVYDAAADGRRLYLNGKLLKAEGGGGMEQPTPSVVTRAYVLQRWMAACAGRGNFPTKFNGSIFTVDPELTDPKQQFNPDWRRWGDCFWWQNTRFPAWSAVANGDYDLCGPVFRMYRDVLPICKARAKLYYGAEGAYFPETMTSFGTYANRDYGWDRKGKEPGDIACKYWCYAWQQGLELVALMLDCHERTLDAKFLADELVPMAREVLRYFDTRFQRDANGKLVISPTQAVETYWFDVVNDTPTVAGLQAVLDRLLALPKNSVPAADREFWAKMKAAAPPVPVRTEDGKSFVSPAEKFNPKRSNCENPELYAVWPFRLFAVGRPGLETGIETFNRRGAKIMTGWCYDGQCAALLGMTDEAKKQILHKVRNSHRNFRFPAMWGPNFDWLPDQDHGGNILLTLQHMILNADGDKIHVLPAWPKDWNLHFKLHAPQRTTVEGRVRDGKLVNLVVTPKSREKDVVVTEPR
ncbi:MAG: LamG domain-containing protein, partial [Verrucomicrobiia bacterium]